MNQSKPGQIEICGLKVGLDAKPLVIAELSGNHNGSLDRALELLEIAHASGADAVKIQTYTPDTMTIQSDRDDFRVKEGLWAGKTLYDLYEWAHTPWSWHETLFKRAKELDIPLFSTPFDETAVDLLEELGAPAYKIASFEMTDLPLLKRVAETGKPVIISTGMATETEIEEAVETLRATGNEQLVVLHCISSYPAMAEDSNLRAIQTLNQKFDVLTGLSDHSLPNTAALVSVGLGACVIEKHFTRDRSEGGPDAAFSLEPHELEKLCDDVRCAWQALGNGKLERAESEEKSLIFRRSLYAVADIEAGETITAENLRRIRPGYGIAPKYYDELLGKKAPCRIERGTPITADLYPKIIR